MDRPDDSLLTLQDAADQLGVHYMTVYRYVRLGLLDAERRGRSWAVTSEALAAFVAERDGAGPAARGARPQADWSSRLERRLLAGDRQGSIGVLESALAAGTDPVGLHVDVVAPAMVSIGQRWADGEIDVADEHRASVLVGQVLSVVGTRFSRRGTRRGRVVLGAAPGEQHALPVHLLAEVVRVAGFEVEDLGADVPAASFAHIASTSPDLHAVGISVTVPGSVDAVRSATMAVRAASSVPIILGGAAVAGEAQARELGADHWAADARDAVAILQGLGAT